MTKLSWITGCCVLGVFFVGGCLPWRRTTDKHTHVPLDTAQVQNAADRAGACLVNFVMKANDGLPSRPVEILPAALLLPATEPSPPLVARSNAGNPSDGPSMQNPFGMQPQAWHQPQPSARQQPDYSVEDGGWQDVPLLDPHLFTRTPIPGVPHDPQAALMAMDHRGDYKNRAEVMMDVDFAEASQQPVQSTQLPPRTFTHTGTGASGTQARKPPRPIARTSLNMWAREAQACPKELLVELAEIETPELEDQPAFFTSTLSRDETLPANLAENIPMPEVTPDPRLPVFAR